MKANNQSVVAGLIGVLAVVAVILGAVGGIAAPVAAATNTTTTTTTNTTTTPSTYQVNVSATSAGNATALQVYVNGTSQSWDLIANGTFSTTLASGTPVSVKYVNATGNVTATSTVTVGNLTSNPETIAVSDASINVSETAPASGGGAPAGAPAMPTWLTHSIIAALVVTALFWMISRAGDEV